MVRCNDPRVKRKPKPDGSGHGRVAGAAEAEGRAIGGPVDRPRSETVFFGPMSSKSFDIPVEIRFRDLDAYGHVNNASYFTLFETARVKFLQGYYPEGLESGPLFLVARASCDFKRPLGLLPEVTVRLRATRFGRSSFFLEYQILGSEGEPVYAAAETRMVCVDRENHRPTAVPEGFRELVEE